MQRSLVNPMLCLLLPLAASAGCRAPRVLPAPPAPVLGPERALDWTLGRWVGIRRDGADGSEEPMVMHVASILGGSGQTREMEIVHDDGVYFGFCVQVYEPHTNRWHRRYVNAVRREYARLEGEVERERSVWRSTSPTRSRESRIISERSTHDSWRRTMSVSEDGGATWRVLWVDELRRGRCYPRTGLSP